ncbi:hypothetical protein [Schaedlerella arabinosiphila]|nr:hypothetical protein [Schaedlerella arabinosiphila]
MIEKNRGNEVILEMVEALKNKNFEFPRADYKCERYFVCADSYGHKCMQSTEIYIISQAPIMDTVTPMTKDKSDERGSQNEYKGKNRTQERNGIFKIRIQKIHR